MSLAARRRADLPLRWAATGPYAAVHPLQQVVVDVRLRVAFLVLSGAPGALLAILQDAQGLLDAGARLCQQGTRHLRGGAAQRLELAKERGDAGDLLRRPAGAVSW